MLSLYLLSDITAFTMTADNIDRGPVEGTTETSQEMNKQAELHRDVEVGTEIDIDRIERVYK